MFFSEKFDQCLTDFCRFGKRKKNYSNNKNFKNTKYAPKTPCLHPGDKVFFLMYCGAMELWEEGVINKRVGGIMHMLKGKKYEHQRHRFVETTIH